MYWLTKAVHSFDRTTPKSTRERVQKGLFSTRNRLPTVKAPFGGLHVHTKGVPLMPRNRTRRAVVNCLDSEAPFPCFCFHLEHEKGYNYIKISSRGIDQKYPYVYLIRYRFHDWMAFARFFILIHYENLFQKVFMRICATWIKFPKFFLKIMIWVTVELSESNESKLKCHKI